MNWNGLPDYAAFWTGVAAEVEAGRTILFVARRGAETLGTAQLQLIGKPNQPHRAEIAKVLVHSRARWCSTPPRTARRAGSTASWAGPNSARSRASR